MGASGKQAQHANRIGCVDWLVENLVVDYDYCIGSEHWIVRMLSGDGLSFLAREAFCAVLCILAWKRIFEDVRGMNFEGDFRGAQDFLTSRRGRS
jgi:hypothetical protein